MRYATTLIEGMWYAHVSFEVSEKAVREWNTVSRQPRGILAAGIDIGINTSWLYTLRTD